MAYSAEQWERTKALFESGQYSLSEIQAKTGISKSKISEKSKKELWERGRNADYIEAKVTIAERREHEKGTVIQVLDDIAYEKIRNKELVFNVAQKALKKLDKMLDEVDNPTDVKMVIDATDRASLTLGVNQRHAPKGDVNVQTNTAVANNNITVEYID